MTTRHLLRHLFYSHVFASYLAAVAAGAMFSGFSAFKFAECAFPMYLAPLILPPALMFENETQIIIATAIYALAFCISIALLRRRQVRWEILEQKRIEAVRAEPLPIVPLEYHSPVQIEKAKYGKVELIALGSGLASIAGICICVAVNVSAEDSGNASLASRILWLPLILIPGLIATITGLVGCFRTKPHTGPRQAAFVGMCIGIVIWLFAFFAIYESLTGIAGYG